MEKINFAKNFIEFTYKSVSACHGVKEVTDILIKNDFRRLNLKEHWNIIPGKKYFIKRTNSTFIAFTTGKNINSKTTFRIVGTHTDSPGFKIKPNPEIISEGFLRLNTEVYGSPILSTWFDRPLSIAGRLIVKGKDKFTPKTLNIRINRPLLTIPNLAIHQNRTVNEGYKFDKQNDLLPVISLINDTFEKNDYLLKFIAEEYKTDIKDIIDFDLYLYDFEKGDILGINNEFISAPKIDNLASVYAGLHALLESNIHENNINVLVGFDNEEVGSSSKQGANSNYLTNVLERIFYSLGFSREDFLETVYKSFVVSADGAHATHPAHPEKSDPAVKVRLNKGIVLKNSAMQNYTSDGYSATVIRQIAKGRVKLQNFVNNSKYRGGSTIGPLFSTHFDADSVDLGIPMLAMHSIRELCGVDDLYSLKELLRYFWLEE